MKQRLAVVLVWCLVIGLVGMVTPAAGAVEENLLFNSGFEEATGNDPTFNWQHPLVSGSDVAGEITAEDKHAGEKSLKLNGISSALPATSQFIAAEDNTDYLLTFYAKIPQGAAYISFNTTQGEVGAWNLIPNSTDWQLVQIPVNSGEGAWMFYVTVINMLTGDQTGYLDDFCLTKVDRAQIQNGGMENGLAGWTVAQGQEAAVSADTAVRHSGTASMKLVGPATGAVYAVSQTLQLEVGQEYQLTFYYQSDTFMHIDIQNVTMPITGWQTAPASPGVFTAQQITFTPTAERVPIHFILNPGTMYVDDVKVYKMAPETVLNGDFESGALYWTFLPDSPFSIQPTGGVGGSKSLHVSGGAAVSFVSQTIAVQPDQAYALTFAAKGSGTLYLAANNAATQGEQRGWYVVTPGTAFVEQTMYVKTKADCTALELLFVAEAGAAYDVDNVTLVPAPDYACYTDDVRCFADAAGPVDTYDGDTLRASFTLKTTQATEQTVMVLLAVYDNGELVRVAANRVVVPAGNDGIRVEGPMLTGLAPKAGSAAKLFVWDMDQRPLMGVRVIQSAAQAE